MAMTENDGAKRGWACAPPGSPEAVKEHCACPVIDNGHGRGAWGTAGLPVGERVYVVNADCPLHGTARQEAAGDESDHD